MRVINYILMTIFGYLVKYQARNVMNGTCMANLVNLGVRLKMSMMTKLTKLDINAPNQIYICILCIFCVVLLLADSFDEVFQSVRY